MAYPARKTPKSWDTRKDEGFTASILTGPFSHLASLMKMETGMCFRKRRTGHLYFRASWMVEDGYVSCFYPIPALPWTRVLTVKSGMKEVTWPVNIYHVCQIPFQTPALVCFSKTIVGRITLALHLIAAGNISFSFTLCPSSPLLVHFFPFPSLLASQGTQYQVFIAAVDRALPENLWSLR